MIIGSLRKHFETVTSTNALAGLMLRSEKPPEGTVITASFQESGRGQKGNSWESEPGKNLLMSVILYPVMVKPEQQFILSQMVSLAVRDLVASEIPDVSIKWPNDIYVRDEKIAGILIENSIMGTRLTSSVAGIGLNVNQTVFTGNAANPVSMAQITGKRYDLALITEEMISLLDKRYDMLIKNQFQSISDEYHSALYRLGKWCLYHDARGQFTGMIDHVSNDGLLSVRKKNGRMTRYALREIDYIL